MGRERRAPHQIEGEFGLLDQQVEHVEWEIGVDGTQRGDEMVLEGADGSLCLVASVAAWWYVLYSNAWRVLAAVVNAASPFVVEKNLKTRTQKQAQKGGQPLFLFTLDLSASFC